MNVANEILDYEAAGALAEELPYWGWLEDGRSCLTRSGELVSVGRLSPVVLDGRTPDQLDRVLERWQRMLSGVDPRTRLYFYLFRRPTRFEDAHGRQGVSALSRRKRRAFLAERVRDVDIYLAWSYDPRLAAAAKGRGGKPWWMSHARNWLARKRNAHESVYLYSNIRAAAERFRRLVDSSRALVADLTPIQLLDAHAGSRVLSELINRPGTPWDGATGSGMNWRLAVSELEAERRYLRLDGEPVILYSLLSPPGGARANLLNDLYCLDARMTIAIEWRPWGLDSARRKIRSAQRHYFSKRYSMAAHMQETEGTSAAMADTAAAAESDRLGDALVELETDGISYGDLSLSIALHGELDKTERLDGDIRRIFAAHDAKAIREGYGQLANWFSRLPAQPRKRQVRSVFMSAGAAACLAPIFGPPRGSPRSRHLDRESLAVLETRWKTPYYYDLFHGDVGHTLVLGATGAGKSFALNFLLVEALQYDPARSDSRPGRLLPLADELSGRRIYGVVARQRHRRRRRGGRRLSTAALFASGGGTDLSVSHRLADSPVANRRVAGRRGGPQRNPRPRRGPLCLSARAADPGSAGPFPALEDVVGPRPLARRGGLGPLLRQPRGRRRPRARRLAGDRPGGRGRA